MANGEFLRKAFETDAAPEIRRRFTGQSGTIYHTRPDLGALGQILAGPLYLREGRDVKVVEYPANRTFRLADTQGRYIFILDQPPRNDIGDDIAPQITSRYSQDARRMSAPGGVWLVGMPEVERQHVVIKDLLEEIENIGTHNEQASPTL